MVEPTRRMEEVMGGRDRQGEGPLLWRVKLEWQKGGKTTGRG